MARHTPQTVLLPVATGTPLAIGFRAGDRLLGLRNGTTAKLVASGRLRPVLYGARARVLRADLERVAAEGIRDDGARPRAPRRKRPSAAGVGAEIMAIAIPERRQP